MTFVGTALGAAVAVAVELLESLAIVLAVGATRRWTDALIGAAAAAVACLMLAVLLGPVLLEQLSEDTLHLVIGTLLLLFGLEWLRKGTLRLAGRRKRSSSVREYEEQVEELEHTSVAAAGPDWAARVVAFKGVFIEGVEIVLIVVALGGGSEGPAPVVIGTLAAVLLVCGAGVWLRAPLARVPETELKYGVGVLLTSFGVFFAGEGIGADWPGGDLALVYLCVWFALVTQVQIRAFGRRMVPA
jgi:uncharacterized membrane protein